MFRCPDAPRDLDIDEFQNIRKLLETVVTTQQKSDQKLDSICEGLGSIDEKRRGPFAHNANIGLPLEIEDLADLILSNIGDVLKLIQTSYLRKLVPLLLNAHILSYTIFTQVRESK